MLTVDDRKNPQLRTLSGLWKKFKPNTSPRILFALFGGGLLVRCTLGSWKTLDLKGLGWLLVLWGLIEYILHRGVLHQPLTGKFHAEHHKRPHDMDGFIPLQLFLVVPPLVLGVSYWVMGAWAQAMTLFAGFFGLTLMYEWTHFWVHSPYQPTTWWGKLIKQIHMLHHFRNPNHFWGVSMPSWADAVDLLYHGYLPWRAHKDVPKVDWKQDILQS